jgi:hypothetical protein
MIPRSASQLLYVAEAERGAEVEPDGVRDHLAREPVAVVQVTARSHGRGPKGRHRALTYTWALDVTEPA